MYKNLKIAVVIPCYNEEQMITKTLTTLPESVDYIITVNDASKDDTLRVMRSMERKNKKIIVLDNDKNGGVGFSLMRGFKHALNETDADAIGIVAGDAQCDPSYIEPMLDEFIDHNWDYVKANRFYHRDALKQMPAFRKIGNVFISLLTKFSTGYYSVGDTQNSFGFLRRSILEQVDFSFVKPRYDYENTMLIALSIVDARIKDYPVPAIYGDEKSTINLLPTVARTLRSVFKGFWLRIYYKYILYSFHPIALFLFSSLILSLLGLVISIVILYDKLVHNLTPSTGTVMLAVLPIILGFQLLLTAIIMDVQNEGGS